MRTLLRKLWYLFDGHVLRPWLWKIREALGRRRLRSAMRRRNSPADIVCGSSTGGFDGQSEFMASHRAPQDRADFTAQYPERGPIPKAEDIKDECFMYVPSGEGGDRV